MKVVAHKKTVEKIVPVVTSSSFAASVVVVYGDLQTYRTEVTIIPIQGFWLFDSPIEIVLTYELAQNIMILKMAEGRGTAYKSPQLLPSLYS